MQSGLSSPLAGTAASLPSKVHGPFKAPGAEDFFFSPIAFFGHPLGFTAFGARWGLNRVVLLEFLTAGVVCGVFALAARRARVVPGKYSVQNVTEMVLEFVRRDVVDETLGTEGHRFYGYFVAVFCFVLVGNLFEIVPLVNFPVTSRMAIPFFLAIFTWVLFNYQGIKRHGFGQYMKNSIVPPGVPWYLLLLVVPIEFISTFVLRPFTLAIRLCANMIAGHLTLGIFFAATQYLLAGVLYEKAFTAIFGIGSLLMCFVFTAFELLVGALQAYIFVLLTGVYLAGSLEPEH
ncbi:MAG: synthase subunit a [Mycobacterium sp.]|nr:synthase subunit a [Mycobacterium sp.]